MPLHFQDLSPWDSANAAKKVHLRHLSEDCRALIDKAESIIEVNHFEDPTYKVVRDVR